MKSFIDCHRHVFNLVDIPMYLTLADKVKMGTVARLKAATMGIAALPLFLADRNLVGRKVREQKEFLLFFERGVARNIETILREIRAHIKADPATPDDAEVLITPLVMDFDVLLEKEMPEQVGMEPSVREQYARLVRAINSPIVKGVPHAKVCPFVGFDLRKLKVGKLPGLKRFWARHNTLGSGNLGSLRSGRLLGIKLYPPIGFNPCPRPLPPGYEAFYRWCCEKDIPLTTHCQTGSFAAGKEKRKLDGNTTPGNWQRLLRYPDFRKLRVNFAHLGGETGTDDMFEPFRIDRDSWTYIIIQLLKKYPNTYADISAYDYAKKEHRRDLMRIFEKDAAGGFGAGYSLSDKILWGSDVPMVISDRSYRKGHQSSGASQYKYYIRSFIDTVASSKLSPADQATLISNLTETNPKRFLKIQ